jgi:hypothetical protein
MPPAFNLSQDQTLKFNLSKLNSNSLLTFGVEYSIILRPLIVTTQTKHPHLSVVLLFKELRRLNSEGRILHTLNMQSTCFFKQTDRFLLHTKRLEAGHRMI